MLLLYRDQAHRLRVVKVPVFREEDRVPAPSPESYGMPWSQVPPAEKQAMYEEDCRRRAERERLAALESTPPAPEVPTTADRTDPSGPGPR